MSDVLQVHNQIVNYVLKTFDSVTLHLVGQVYKVSRQDITILTEVVFTTQFTFASIPRMQQSSLKMWLEI